MSDDRRIRVFISSTFRDMQIDRDVLVKKVFPQLRKLCESRAVAWTEVDLRWGITSEQQAEGKVLPYCLAEIERSRPFFIGLLGERYGWMPQSIPAELLEKQPWLREHIERSVTELEILHGVLNNPAMAERALFYFRDPAYATAAAVEKTSDFVETGPNAGRMQQKLIILKDRIRTAAEQKKLKYPPRENYRDPEALGDLILADFTQIIDELYPADEVPDPLDQEANRHEEYARSRRELYIARPRYFELLHKHVESPNPPLVLTGESGCGKTALLANWVDRYRQSHPQDLIIQHYIGSTPDSADWMRVVNRILGELKRAFNVSDELPSTPDELRSALDEWFVKTAGSRRIVLVLDGLNQLDDKDNAGNLVWLPRVFPRNVRVLASCLPGKAFDASQQRKWPTTAVELLNADERGEIVSGYLGLGGRTASKELLSAIEAQPQTLNPLYLRAFLDEIRVFGRIEELPSATLRYLSAPTPGELYRLIIQRWVQDYPEARVADVLRLIWAARRGLSEAELMDVLGQDGHPMPRRYWTPFYLVAERSLAIRSGLLSFGHDYLRVAVQQELLANDASKESIRLQLARHFQKIDEPTDRKAEELPWLLRQAQAWEELKNCLTNLPLFQKLREDRWKWELHGHWMVLQDRFDPVRCYGAALEQLLQTGVDEQERAATLSEVASFHYDAGRYAPAEPLFRQTLEVHERVLGPEHPHTLNSVLCLANLLHHKGDYDAAEPLYRRSLEARERVLGPEHPGTVGFVTGLANLLHDKGDYDAAEPLYRRALETRERVLGPEHPDTLICMNNLAALLYHKGDYAGAEPLYRRALERRQQVLGPEHPHTLICMSNLAELLRARGDYAGAEPLYRRALETQERVLGPEHPETLTVVNNFASLLHDKGDYVGAEPLYRRALEAQERVLRPEHPETLTSVHNLANLLHHKGDYAGAEPLFRRALGAQERVLGPEHPHTLICMNNLAELLRARGDYAGAEFLYRRAFEARERVLGPEHPETLTSVNDLANLLHDKGDYAAAEPLYRRTLEARQRMLGPDHPKTLTSVEKLADVLEKKADYAGAESLYRRALEAKERGGQDNHPEFALDLNNYALLLRKLGRYDESAAFLRRAIAIEDRLLPPGHPKRAHRRNNVSTCCLVGGQLEQAMLANAESWRLKERQHDLTSGRILFTRVALCWLCHADTKLYLGQLKTLLAQSELPCLGGVNRKWDARDVLEHLRSKLPADAGEFLSALFEVLNDRTRMPELDRFEQWRAATATPLETPWPSV